ncbi:tRNA preQ1(34) S-adenosylmethionine ribosyltransferase-isomerase QueA, partial [Staphylococcus cohnii]
MEAFDDSLPEALIAQTPLKSRDESKLLFLVRQTGDIEHKHFKDVIDYVEKGDTLVLNDTRVMPARLFGLKEETGAKVEMLMLTQISGNDWEVLLKPAERITVGNKLSFGDGKIVAECIEELNQGGRIMRLHYEGILQERLDELGEMPLPPYIKERLDDQDRYQTVYAKASGSAAAPTAGLHFTDELLNRIKAKGIN